MTVSPRPPEDVQPVPPAPSDPEGGRDLDSRRAFLGDVARKAKYVTPAVLVLTARRAVAGPSGCGQTGSVCYQDADCCGGWTCLDMGLPVMMGMTGFCE